MTDGPDPRIVAVVVTFNRLPLLQRLVAAAAEECRAGGDPRRRQRLRPTARGSGSGRGGRRTTAPALVAHPLDRNRGGAGGFHEGLRLAVERGADLVWLMDDDGLPEPDCLEALLDARRPRLLGAASSSTRTTRAGWCSRSGCPAAPAWCTGCATSRAAAATALIRDVVIPFNGVLVTRELVERIGLPREEFFIWGDDHEYRLRAERAGARIATVVDAARAAPVRRRPRHADDVRPDDVQPQPERPQALLHGAQQPAQPARVPRLAARAGVRGQDGVVLHVHPPRPRPAAAELAGDARRPARRLHRAREVPVDDRVRRGRHRTFNRADLLTGMLDGLAAQTRRPDAVFVVDNASTDHTREVLEARAKRGDIPLDLTHSDDNLGGAGGFQPRRHAGVRRGLRPDLAGGRRRRPRARLPRRC